MTNNLQDRFREKLSFTNELLEREAPICLDAILKFISSEIEQAKKDLINQLLSEAPKDSNEMIIDIGFKECNNQWRTLLESKLK